MGDDRRSFGRDALAYLRIVDNWPDAVLAAIGGYAAAMFVWEMAQRAVLSSFLLKNVLPLQARRDLALLLVGGIVAALFLWLLLGWALARFHRLPVNAALHRSARVIFLATPLPLLPILALPGLEQDQPFFVFGIVAAAAALTFVAVRGVLAPMPDAPAAAHPSSIVGRRSSVVRPPPSARAGLILTLALAVGYAFFMSALSVARHNSFMTHAFDLGIQDQVVYNILHTGRMVTTLLGPVERVYDHFSPLFYFVAPIYALFQDARTLLVLQSVFLGIGAIPLYLLTMDKTGSIVLAFALAASYLLYPAVHGVNLGDFHQIALVSGLLLWALYFLERERDRLFLVTLLLALLAKEEVALSVAAIGIYILLAKRRWRLGLALAALGSLYFIVVVSWLMPILGSVESAEWRYANFMIPGKSLQQSFILNFVTNPLYPIIYVLSNPGKLVYAAQLFLPVLFLPVLAPIGAWIAALPALLLPLLTVPEADYGIRFHYSAHVTPFVFFLTVLALHKLGKRRLKPTALAASILVASIAMSYQYGQIISKQGVLIPRPSKHAAVIKGFFSDIPREASVSTMSDLTPHLSARERIYLFPVVADADYLLFDSDMKANYWPHTGLKARAEAMRDLAPQIQSGQFGLVRLEDGVMLLKRGNDTVRNDEALRALFSARYEAEDLSSDLDAPAVPDPQASRGKARIATPASLRGDGKTALGFGPYTDLPPGKYRAEFMLKTDRNDRSERVATVDVFTHNDGYPRAEREILGTDFAAANRYQPFAIEFESDKPLEDLEFRVQYAGVGTLGLDAVQVTPVELWLK